MMIRINYILIGLFIGILFTSCGAKKKVKRNSNSGDNTSSNKEIIRKEATSDAKEEVRTTISSARLNTVDYIERYSDIAVSQMKELHIPASITLAQGILESNSGNSDLTRNSNNHFGIKCHKNWNGLRTFYDDDAKGECFRVYKDPAMSFQDHGMFLTQRSRYEGLFKLRKNDYKAWAKGLQKAGYATDKKYPQKLIRIIEKYELYKYDEVVLGRKTRTVDTSRQVIEIIDKNALFYVVKKGDGLYGISRKFGLKVDDLKRFNDLNSNTIFPGQKLYIRPIESQIIEVETKEEPTQIESAVPEKEEISVRTAADIIEVVSAKVDTVPPKTEIETRNPISNTQPSYHIVKAQETLYQIAYMYKLEVPDIRRWNGIKKDEIRIGQKLFVRKPAQVPSTTSDSKTHTVIKGDTLFSLARKYGMTVSKMKSMNDLQEDTISIGQLLLVK